MIPKNRCKKCNGKSSFLFDCRCNNSYCSKHFLPEIHECAQIELFKKESYEKNKNKLIEQAEKEKKEWV